MQHLVVQAGLGDQIRVESAGVGAQLGAPADPRSCATAARNGIELHSRSRSFHRTDLDDFDYILMMDQQNLAALRMLSESPAHRPKLRLLRDFDPDSPPDAEVPDPFRGDDGFDRVFALCEAACRGLLLQIRSDHQI